MLSRSVDIVINRPPLYDYDMRMYTFDLERNDFLESFFARGPLKRSSWNILGGWST